MKVIARETSAMTRKNTCSDRRERPRRAWRSVITFVRLTLCVGSRIRSRLSGSNTARALVRTSRRAQVTLCRHQTLQLLVPMLYDNERGRREAPVGARRLDHQELLTIGRHVVRTASGGAAEIVSTEQLHRRARVPRRAAHLHRNLPQ